MRTFATFVSLVVATARVPSVSTAPPPAPPTTTDALTRHRVHATLEGGVAIVAEELTFHADAPATEEVSWTLSVPADAELVALEACLAGRCRRGIHVGSAEQVFEGALYAGHAPGAPPLVLARRDGERLTLRVAGLEPADAEVRVAWSARTERLGGVEHLRIPARHDAAELTLVSASLDALSVDGDAAIDHTPTGRAFELVGTSRPGAPSVEVTQVDARGTGWVRLLAPAVAPSARDVTLLVDVSPSARDRDEELTEALRLSLAAAPDGSTVTVIAFARRARVIARGPVETLRGATPPLPEDLGPSTSLRAAMELLPDDEEPAHTSLVWLGDGGLAWGADERAAETSFLRRGGHRVVVGEGPRGVAMRVAPLADPSRTRARLASLFADAAEVRVGDRSFWVAGGSALWLTEPDVRRIDAATSSVPPIAAAPLVRAQLGWSRPRELITLDPRDRHAAHKLRRGELAIFRGGGALDYRGVPRIRVCVCSLEPWGGLSRESLRRTMRHVRPAVDACFSDARHGDPHYEARATYVLGLEDDELAYADVETNDPALRACMLRALDGLVSPTFDTRHGARTMVRYPFVATARDIAGPMPLEDATAASVDALFGDEPAIPPRSLLPALASPTDPERP